jgi:hypothetical protein
MWPEEKSTEKLGTQKAHTTPSIAVPVEPLPIKIALDDNTLRALCAIVVLQGSIASGRDFGTPHCVFLANSFMKDLKQLSQ